MNKALPYILDSTVIFNFCNIGRFNILSQLSAGNMILPADVKIEIGTDSIAAPIIEQAIGDKIVEEYVINYTCDSEEIKMYINIRKRYGAGEAACIAIAKSFSATVASDDMRAAPRICNKYGIDLIGTLGILYEAYEKSLIDREEGQVILEDMINIRGYKSPVDNFDDIVNWFERGQGRELF